MLGPYFQHLPLSPLHCPRWVSWPLMDQRRRRKALSGSGFSISHLFSSSSFPFTLPMERSPSFMGCLFPSLPCTASLPPLFLSPGICLDPGHAHRGLGKRTSACSCREPLHSPAYSIKFSSTEAPRVLQGRAFSGTAGSPKEPKDFQLVSV